MPRLIAILRHEKFLYITTFTLTHYGIWVYAGDLSVQLVYLKQPLKNMKAVIEYSRIV